ncbi:MAG: hypothetical protein AAB152_08145 [Candidatus Coatesbacteria bacterium]
MTLALAAQAVAADATATTAAAPAAAPKKRAAAPVKVTASQLWMRLDTIEGRLDLMQKSLESIGKSATTAATAAATAAASARPTVQMPGPGEGAQAKELAGAFYNHGVYQRRAANTRLASTLIRDVMVLSGTVVAFIGYEDGRSKTAPRTIRLAYKEYRGFTVGVSMAAIGVIVSEFVNLSANRSEASAAKALMRPLEEEPPSGPAPRVEVQ